MITIERDDRGLVCALVGDGRPLILLVGLGLVLSGLFALFLSATGQFLPHDVQFLGMTPDDLCAINQCRIRHFMLHNRVAFGGSLIATGLLYLWLAEFPLRRREPWAWWLLLVSGLVGFGSFLTYLGHGYLDMWHGSATLVLLPCFILGLAVSYRTLRRPAAFQCLFRQAVSVRWSSPFGLGRACLLAAAVGQILGGLTIMIVAMTCVFVPQDLQYLDLTVRDLDALNPRLIPLIAHDRAGFGGGVCTFGIVLFFCVWCGTPSRSLWQVLFLSGAFAYGTAISVHPLIGYTDLFHLAPAMLGGMLLVVGLILSLKPMVLPIAAGR